MERPRIRRRWLFLLLGVGLLAGLTLAWRGRGLDIDREIRQTSHGGDDDSPTVATLAGRAEPPIRSEVPAAEGPLVAEEPAASDAASVDGIGGRVSFLGVGVEGADVVATPRWPFSLLPSTRTSTDAQGRFELYTVDSVRYEVVATADVAGTRCWAQVDGHARCGDLELSLAPLDRELSIMVYAHDERPLAGARIRLLTRSGLGDAAKAEHVTDARGELLLSGLPRSWIHVRADYDGYLSRVAPVDLSRKRTKPLVFRLAEGTNLPLRCVAEGTDEPVPGATVWVAGCDRETGGTTDAKGRCDLRVVGRSGVRVEVEAAGHAPRSAVLELGRDTSQDGTVRTIEVARSVPVTVRLPPDRTGGLLLVGSVGRDSHVLDTLRLPAGASHSIRGVAANRTVVVRVDFEDGSRYLGLHAFAEQAARGGVELDLEDPALRDNYAHGHEIHVRAGTGPSAGLPDRVVVGVRRRGYRSKLLSFSAETPPNSVVSFALPRARDWVVTIRDAAGELGEEDLASRSEVVDLGVLCRDTLLVRGVVVDTEGAPFVAAAVFIARSGGSSGTARSDADGRWAARLRDVSDGEVIRAFAVSGAGRSAVVPVDPGGSTRIVLER